MNEHINKYNISDINKCHEKNRVWKGSREHVCSCVGVEGLQFLRDGQRSDLLTEKVTLEH